MDFVQQLEGMYALALYHEPSEVLVLARDPVGIKPLYMAETSLGVAFASEPRALVRSGWLSAEVVLAGAGTGRPHVRGRSHSRTEPALS